MIIVEAQKLKFLLAGRTLTLEVHREYRKGRDYAVGKTVRKATCRAIVESCEQIGGKTWRIEIRHAMQQKPVWMAKRDVRGDYTTDPSKAMLDEPEVIDPPERYLKFAANRDDAVRRERAREQRKRGRAA